MQFANGLHSKIAWNPAAWQLFKFFQGCLRRLWSGDFASQTADGTRFLDGPYLSYLLGLDVSYSEHAVIGYTDARLPDPAELPNAWARVLAAFPTASVTRTSVIPGWTSGQFVYYRQSIPKGA